MKKAAMLLLLVSTCLLLGWFTSGPEKTLADMATALNKKDPALFMGQMDLKRYAAAKINNMTQGDAALRALDSMGKMLGLGSMDDLLGSVVDMQAELEKKYTREVSTGELMLECRGATTPDCPFVPEALERAKIKEISPVAAVAQVTTPTNITSWLALSKQGGRWVVVGQAPLESQASQYALGTLDPPVSSQPNIPAVPSQPTPSQPANPAENPQEPVRL